MTIDFHQSASCDGSVKAGFLGAATGLLNIVGLGGLVPNNGQADAQAALTAANNALQSATTQWTTAITNEKYKIIEDQIDNVQSLVTTATNQQAVINESLGEKIETNALLIGMLVALVAFLVMYDII